MANDGQDLSPIGAGETTCGDRGGRRNLGTDAIRSKDLDNGEGPRGRTMPRADIEAYAPKGAATSASREDSNQVNTRNTNRGVRGETVRTVTARDAGRPAPDEPTPYANEARTSAARRDADGQ